MSNKFSLFRTCVIHFVPCLRGSLILTHCTFKRQIVFLVETVDKMRKGWRIQMGTERAQCVRIEQF